MNNLKWLLCLLIFLPSMAQTAVIVPHLSMGPVTSAAGNKLTVSVIADLPQATNSMQFNVQFDPKLLTVASVKPGTANPRWIIVDNAKKPGLVIVGMFNIGGAPAVVLGPQRQVAVINFTVNNPPGSATASSPLTLSKVIFDRTGVIQLTNGRVDIHRDNTIVIKKL